MELVEEQVQVLPLAALEPGERFASTATSECPPAVYQVLPFRNRRSSA